MDAGAKGAGLVFSSLSDCFSVLFPFVLFFRFQLFFLHNLQTKTGYSCNKSVQVVGMNLPVQSGLNAQSRLHAMASSTDMNDLPSSRMYGLPLTTWPKMDRARLNSEKHGMLPCRVATPEPP